MPDTYAPVAEAEPAPLLAARIDISFVGYKAKGIVWRAEHDGKVILERARLPPDRSLSLAPRRRDQGPSF